MKSAPLIWLFAVSLLVTCCSQHEKPLATVEVNDGVTLVHNQATPRFPGKAVVFAEELAISPKDAEGNIILSEPGRFAVDAHGNIFIVDRQDLIIRVFDPQGRHIRSFGKKGEGPGEFQGILGMTFLPDGRLICTDTALRRTSLFDREGNFQSTHKWRGFLLDLYLATDSAYFANETLFGQPSRMFVKKFDLEGKELLSLGEFKPLGIKMLRSGNTSFGISLPYTPRSVLAGDPNSHLLYHCLNDTYLIEVYDAEGTLFRKIDRPYELLPFTHEDAREYYDSFADNPSQVFVEMAKDVELPSVKTVTESMLIDEGGRLWVGLHEKKEMEERELTAYDIFDPEGLYSAKVWSEYQPSLFKNGKMYTYVTDEDGYRTLKRFGMKWED